jgi:serine-type D-Ala-D-Ala carboxypeptidase (penicillin-binding protein 5/6)
MAKKKRAVFTQKAPWYKTRWDKIVYLVIFAFVILAMPGQNIYSAGELAENSVIKILPFTIPVPAQYPVNTTGAYPGSDVTATGIVVLDIDSDVYIYKRNADELLSPASTTKILTALVALDTYSLDDIVTVHTVMNDGQVIGLVPGERITVENLLFGALIHSGNDAAYTLAEHYPGGVEKFVAAMNKKAKELHLDHSNFTNPVGYDDPNHKMTPTDLARLGEVALDNKIIAKMVAIPQITISDVTHTYFHALKNVNELLGKIPGVGGIKTGWTEEAGENLMTLIDRGGHRVIIVVLKSQNRFSDTEKLINWVFSNYQWKDMSPTLIQSTH